MFRLFKENKKIIIYIIILFFITRASLTFIGVSSRMIFDDYVDYDKNFSNNVLLDIWGAWDSGYYLDIANNGYSTKVGKTEMTLNQSNYVFFPLYPMLIRLFSLISINAYVAGIIISNLAFLISAFFLYKIVKIDNEDEVAFMSVKYLFFFPVAFIFSGVFSESLFLMLFLVSYYYAIKNKWLISSVSGGLLALTRPVGVLLFPILFFVYLKNKKYIFKKIRFDIFYLLLIPIGLVIFLFYLNYLTGDIFNYIKVQQLGWGHVTSNPVIVFIKGFFSRDIFQFVNISIVLFFLSLSIINYKNRGMKKIYYLIIFLFIFFPLSSGSVSINSLLRYLLPIFPFYIVLSHFGNRHKIIDQALSIILLMLQGFLMVFWVMGFHLVV